MDLWEVVKSEGCTQLCTRRLNQDCLENFFGKVRRQGGNNLNPTPVQFVRASKKLSCMDLMKCTDTFNCVPDVDTLLLKMQHDVEVTIESRSVVRGDSSFKVDNFSNGSI